MIMLRCEACGGNELKRTGNIYQCTYCGSKYILGESENIVSKKITEAKVIAILENANQLHEADKYAEELEILIKVHEMDENNPSIMVKLGRCYRCLNLPDKAIECYKRTIELNPNEGTAYTNMGTIYTLRQNYEEAAKCFEKGMPMIDKATFDYWVVNANYAIAVAKLGNPKKAEEMIKESEAHGYMNGSQVRKLAGIDDKSLVSRIKSIFYNYIDR